MDMSSLHGGGPSGPAARAQVQRMGRVAQVKNKAPAPVQITAEQLLREAQEFKETSQVTVAREITDPTELKEYQGRKRKEFEDGIRRNRQNIGIWMKYAAWEAKMGEFARARSVFERALDEDYRNQSIWLKYAEMEMRHRQVAHARNVWDRAVTLLPRIDQFWYKYAYMEEMMGELSHARTIFERWMEFHPNEQAWLSYIKFEIRHNNIEGARALYERFTLDHLTLDAYLKYAKFETRHGSVAHARRIFERVQEELTEEERADAGYFTTFAHFEERNKEYDRARAIYQYALDHLPKDKARDLYDQYVAFEKSYGDKEGIELVILSRKRFQYEEELRDSAARGGTGAAHNYDVWFDYLRLEQDRLESVRASSNPAVNNPTQLGVQCARVRELFERAVANVPLVAEKKHWKRYIYIWLQWLLFEELAMGDIERTRTIATRLLGTDIIPHEKFSFAKLWLHYAHFEVRQGALDKARMKLGEGLGRVTAPRTKAKLFAGYLELELHLGALERVRKLYEKFVEFAPATSQTWVDFAAFEARLGEHARARGLFELAVAQPALDQPERVWKAYIEMESAAGHLDQVRALYARLLEKTKHVKVWIAHAQFEATHKQMQAARDIFAKGEEYFKAAQQRMYEEEASNAGMHAAGGMPLGAHASPALLALKEERLLLLQSWRDFERTYGDAASLQSVTARLPQQLKKRRPVYVMGPDGEMVPGAGVEDYYDYTYPEESARAAAGGGASKFMEMAKMWKRQQEAQQAAEQARLEAELDAEERAERQRGEEDGDNKRMQEGGSGEIDIDEDEGDDDGPGAAAPAAAAPAASADDGVQAMEQ